MIIITIIYLSYKTVSSNLSTNIFIFHISTNMGKIEKLPNFSVIIEYDVFRFTITRYLSTHDTGTRLLSIHMVI